MKNCFICNSLSKVIADEMYDNRYGYPEKFSFYECSLCKHKFIDNNFTDSDLESLYSKYYPRNEFSIDNYEIMKSSNKFKEWFNGDKRAFSYIPSDVKILDIGCGFGESIGYHKSRGCDAYGVEADSNIQKVIDAFGFNIKVGLFDYRDYEKNFFDYVTMDQVLEHTRNPLKIMKDISNILKDNGKLIITVPNPNGWGAKFFGKKWINWHIPYHLQHFSKQSIQILAKKSNFKICEIKTTTLSNWLHYQWMSLVCYPKIGEKSLFWNGEAKNIKKVEFKYWGCVFCSIIHFLKINHIITRLFDLIGIGDSYTIILEKSK